MTIDVSSNNIFERIMIDELSVARICLISPRGIASGRFYLFAGKAETPLPMLIVGNVRSEVFGAVIGPICRCDNKFGISYLIEEEVAHTHISTCANKQVRVGNSDCSERSGKCGFVDFVGSERSFGNLAGKLTGGFDYLPASGVA